MRPFSKIWLTTNAILSVAVATLLCDLCHSQSNNQWPEKSIHVDSNVQQTNFEREVLKPEILKPIANADVSSRTQSSFGSHQASGVSKPDSDTQQTLINKIQPVADDLTQKLKDSASGLFDEATPAAGWFEDVKSNMAGVDIGKVLSSLAIVLGGYFGLVWLLRRFNPRSSLGLPQEVVEVLGQTSFGPKKQLQLVRLGSKLLLLMNSTEGTQTIGEISEPSEVDYLASLCGAKRSRRPSRTTTPPLPPQTVPSPPSRTTSNQVTGDLKQIINQLRQVTEQTSSNSIFEA